MIDEHKPQRARGGSFKPGHTRIPGSGRAPGTQNKNTNSIRRLLQANLPEAEMVKMWRHFLHHRNAELRFSAFKLANFYMFGRPAKGPINAEDQPIAAEGPQFDLSQIRTRHVPIQ